jgi:hypothetical protein
VVASPKTKQVVLAPASAEHDVAIGDEVRAREALVGRGTAVVHVRATLLERGPRRGARGDESAAHERVNEIESRVELAPRELG